MPAPATAVVFPGQGSQKRGMAQDFHDQHAVARQTFDEAADALGLDLRALCFGAAPAGVDPLDLTENTQPCILAAEVAMLRALRADHGLVDGLWGGHSLGEYTALVAAGVLPFDEALRLVRARGRLMQAAVPAGEGAMAAVIDEGLDPDALLPLLHDLEVDVANHNALDQVVLSGSAGDVAVAERRVADARPAARVVRLQVSAPFHSRRMRVIEAEFRALLEASAPRWAPAGADRVLSNLHGGFHAPDRAALVDALTRQVSGAVRWVDDMRALLAAQPAAIYEVGPSRPLRAFFRGLGAEVPGIFSVRTAQKAWAPPAGARPA
jgi:malonyl CoA-acyl carrier protein transacylase